MRWGAGGGEGGKGEVGMGQRRKARKRGPRRRWARSCKGYCLASLLCSLNHRKHMLLSSSTGFHGKPTRLSILVGWPCSFVDGDRQVVQLLPLLLLLITTEVRLILHGHDVHLSIIPCTSYLPRVTRTAGALLSIGETVSKLAHVQSTLCAAAAV